MRIAIIGGGPAGYEAALVAAELGAEVRLINDEGLGGNSVLWDCVPSKTLIASAVAYNSLRVADELGLRPATGRDQAPVEVDFAKVLRRVRRLADAQSRDITDEVLKDGAEVVHGHAELIDPHTVEVTDPGGDRDRLTVDAALVATGSDPRTLDTAPTDGEVVLSSRDLYGLDRLPEHLVVVGSGATGAEYAGAFLEFGVDVTFVVSRDRVLPGEDADAALALEEVFHQRGMRTVKNARAAAVRRADGHAVVHLEDGRTLEGSHALLTIGQVPQSYGVGLERVGIAVDDHHAVQVDGVSRTTVPNIYAAGDVTGKVMLASVAAMQGRIAMWHLLGQAVAPLRWDAVAATIFTDPQIATVGLSEQRARRNEIAVEVEKLPLEGNSRAKMNGLRHGFVKLLARPGSGTIVGGAVVADDASDLIAPISVAVTNRLTAAQLTQAFQIYPSLAGSVQEAARRLAIRVQGGYRY
ncbi:MAG TPA: NAD(P)H-quinone dehydrogenase [Actinomycetes bacterium]|nr:NAD(P)H-quinone dehydrogenase [Actinomycetes bacterium]